jgi:hypothetical protein
VVIDEKLRKKIIKYFLKNFIILSFFKLKKHFTKRKKLTEKLYWKTPYETSFKAKVIGVKREGVIL